MASPPEVRASSGGWRRVEQPKHVEKGICHYLPQKHHLRPAGVLGLDRASRPRTPAGKRDCDSSEQNRAASNRSALKTKKDGLA